MTKVTSKLLTLLLAFSMVFTTFGFAGAYEVNATGLTSFTIQLTCSDEADLSGIALEAGDGSGASLEVTTDDSGKATINITDALTCLDAEENYSFALSDESSPWTIKSNVSFQINQDGSSFIVTGTKNNDDCYIIELESTSSGTDSILIDARSPEVYSGWTLGNEPGGHLVGAVNFSARWIDEPYPYDDELGYKTKEEAMQMALTDIGLTNTNKDAAIVVYDTKGEEASKVAAYLEGKGFNNVSVVQKDAADFVTAEKDPNFDMYVPAEVVKNISDFKLGKAELSPEAKAIVGDKKVKILHAEWYTDVSKTAYATTGHVPGAEPITTDDFEPEREQRTGDALVKQEGVKYGTKDSISWSGDYLLATDEKILELAKKYGIYKDDCIIVVGFEPMSTCKIALLMKYLGVENVHVMSGAYNQWPEEYGVEKTINQPVEGTDITEIGKPDVIDTQDEAAVMIKDPNCQLVDTRTEDEFKGLNTGYGYHDIAGRIPGVEANSPSGVGHSSSMYFYRNPDGTMRSSGVIRAMWADQNVDTGKHLSFFCGSGWRAAEETWDAWVMGLHASMYNDGWQGWSNAGRPFIDKDDNNLKLNLASGKLVPAEDPAQYDNKDPNWPLYGISKGAIKDTDVIVDVRDAEKFANGHLKGSINSPVSATITDEQKTALNGIYDANPEKRIVIVCVTGNTLAKNAMNTLKEHGADMNRVTYLIGGANGANELWVKHVDMDANTWKSLGIEKTELKADDLLVDVRTEKLFKEGHLKGSINCPVSNPYTAAQKEAVGKIYDANPGKRIVIVCVSGNMLAKNAMDALFFAGKDLTNVTYLIGGANGAKDQWVTDEEQASDVTDGQKAVVGGNAYTVKSASALTATFTKAKNAKSVTVPATVVINDKTLKVVGIAPKAFKGTKTKTLTVKTKSLTKKSVKNSLKGSKVKTVKVKVSSKKKTNKKYVKKYKKIFTKKNAGKKVSVK